MKLWMLTQNEVGGYDTYDSCIVAANTEQEAKKIYPCTYAEWGSIGRSWASSPDRVTATCIGTATKGTEAGVILASFNAG
jgi:hypothetical protein